MSGFSDWYPIRGLLNWYYSDSQTYNKSRSVESVLNNFFEDEKDGLMVTITVEEYSTLLIENRQFKEEINSIRSQITKIETEKNKQIESLKKQLAESNNSSGEAGLLVKLKQKATDKIY